MPTPNATVVDLPSTRLLVVRASTDEGAAIRQAWHELESKLTSLRGRRFYGVIFAAGDQEGYYAGVEPHTETEITALGFRTLSVPGGKYARAVLKNWREQVDAIPKIVDKLERDFEPDRSRPTIEFYRSQTELHVLVPLSDARQCCFCGNRIDRGPAEITVTFLDGSLQLLWSHIDCLGARLHKTVPWLSQRDREQVEE